MTRSQRKRHLVMWAAVLPIAALMIVLGWFARVDPLAQPDAEVLEPASALTEGPRL
ncbi:hypothetical protein ABWH91_00540 [Phycisphaerales bacterium ac7]